MPGGGLIRLSLKISAEGIGIAISDDFFKRRNFSFMTHNRSRYNVSSANWNAWLFINDEKTSDRHCAIYTSYKIYHGGLPAGASKKSSHDIRGECSAWDTLEVRQSKLYRFKLELDVDSAKDYAEKRILPPSPSTQAVQSARVAREHTANAISNITEAIKNAGKEIEKAMRLRASLL